MIMPFIGICLRWDKTHKQEERLQYWLYVMVELLCQNKKTTDSQSVIYLCFVKSYGVSY